MGARELTLEVDEDPAFAMLVGGFFGVEDEVCTHANKLPISIFQLGLQWHN